MNGSFVGGLVAPMRLSRRRDDWMGKGRDGHGRGLDASMDG